MVFQARINLMLYYKCLAEKVDWSQERRECYDDESEA
jgi:hypothetical protein